jgi:uncharacterized protein
MPTYWVGHLAIGLIAGVASGIFGIGGGVIIVPALIIFLGFTEIEAIATSLGALLLPVGIFAVLVYYRENLLRIRDSALIAFGLLTTVALGSLGALELEAIDPNLLKRIYGLFLVYIGWRFLTPLVLYAEWQARREADTTQELDAVIADQQAAPEALTEPNYPWWAVLLVGLVAGVASGLFGIGGGAVIVPALTAILRYDPKLAVGTSLGALLLPVGLPGVIVYLENDVLNLAVAGLVAFGLLVGAVFGARLAINLPSRTVKRLYGAFLIVIAVRFILF